MNETIDIQEKVSKVIKDKKATCTHCGLECHDNSLIDKELSFCCIGCKNVYNLLNDHDLSLFYKLDQNAGRTQKYTNPTEYDFLDDAELQEKLCNYANGSERKIWLHLPTIHCSSCLWLLENIGRIHEGIKYSSVNYLQKKASIQFDSSAISLKELAQLLSKIGYPPQISLNDLEAPKRTQDKALLYKLGIAGFAFGNIMLLSFPEYLGLDDSDLKFSNVIRYINIILVLPIIFYAASDYFRSAWNGLKQAHLNIDLPISIGILAIFLKSLFDIFVLGEPGYLDSLAGLVFFLLIGKWFQKITYNRIYFDLDYKSYFPLVATVVEGEKENKVSLQKIVPQDRIRVRHGELIPADGTLISSKANIDYSFVTGEKDPVEILVGEMVYSGGRIQGQMVDILITKTVSTSYLTQLWNDVSFQENKERGNISAINEIVAKYFTISILIIAVLSFAYHATNDINLAFNVFTSVLIIACPCAVALTIPFTFGNLTRLLASRNIYFKNTDVVERCARLDHLVFDKTGTITYAKEKQVRKFGKDLNPKEELLIASLASQSSHSSSRMIVNQFSDIKKILNIDCYKEHTGKGIEGQLDEHHLKIGSADFIGMDKVAHFEQSYEAPPRCNVYVELDGNLILAFAKKSQFLDNLPETLTDLSQHYEISLISGDNEQDASALRNLFNGWDNLLFRKSPFEKMNYIKRLQNKDINVAMIGDGLNDAGALSQSDIGIAITENTSNFTPACDIIMDVSQFQLLPNILSVCKSGVHIIYASYTIAFIYNAIGLTYAVQGLLSPLVAAILMPLSSITVVLFGYITSSILIRKSRI